MSDVFVSYARSTAKQAQAVVEALRALGYSVWIDDDLPAHRTFSRVIEEEMAAAKAAVVIWSADAVQSEWVLSEANRAREDRKLVQVTLDHTRLPMPFDQIQCADLVGWSGEAEAQGWRKALASIAALAGGAANVTPRVPSALATTTTPLLAVLAFDNLSGDPQMAWLSDGVSEEILDTMARVSGLRVVGRTSSFQFRGTEKNARRIATELKATHLLDGSVRRAGDRVRVTAQLVECAGETTVWASRFDRELSDVFALQDEIAAAVAEALETVLVRPAQPRRVSPEAYELYLRSRNWGVAMPNPQRLELVERAVALAPDFAAAWAWLGHRLVDVASNERRGAPFEPLKARALEALDAALRLDPTLALPHASASFLEPYAAYERRKSLIDAGLERSQSDVVILICKGELLDQVGRFRDAMAIAKRSKLLDPLNPGTLHSCASQSLRLGSYGECLALCDQGLAKWPQYQNFYLTAAYAALLAVDWPKLAEVLGRVRADPFGAAINDLDKRSNEGIFGFFEALRDADEAFADQAVAGAQTNLQRSGRASLAALYMISSFGRLDEAFAIADRASFAHLFEPGDFHPAGGPNVGFLFSIHNNRAMMQDPRFMRLCAKLGLCDYWVKSDRWPDCADGGVLPYDFRAACRRLAGANA